MIDLTINDLEHDQFKEMMSDFDLDQPLKDQLGNIIRNNNIESKYVEILKLILEAMESSYGVFGYIDKGGALVLPAMTKDIWEFYQMTNENNRIPPENWMGFWGRALREKNITVKKTVPTTKKELTNK